MAPPVARASILHMLPAYLDAAGIRAETVFGMAGMAVADVAQGRVVARAQLCAALHSSARALGDPRLGLVLGAAGEPVRLGDAGIALTSGGSTLAACLRAHIASMPAMQTHVVMKLVREEADAVLHHRLIGDSGEGLGILYEGAAAFTVHALRGLLGASWSPALVVFPHECRSRRGDYEQFFNAPVRFGDQGDAHIRFEAALLDRPLAPAGPRRTTGSAIVRQETVSRGDIGDGELHAALVRMIEATLPHAAASLPRAARTLGLSPRTLQRRLGACGLTFDALLTDIRRDLATRRLREGAASITEIAMGLGYSDAAHFIRAFRRWEGLPPSTWRGLAAAG